MTTTSTSKSEFKKDSNLINDQENITIEPDDPCNNYEWSVMFLLMLILALTFITIESLAMFRRRKNLLSGFDIGVIFLFSCTIIQFGPITSDILHNVGKDSHYTQSGCKVFHYTTFGMRHVILAVIISLLTYAWIITRHNFNQEQLDKRIRDNIAWLIIIAFVIEAIFGITVAVYVDVSPIHATHCIWTPTMSLTKADIVSLEVLLRAVIPYLLPSILLPYPLMILYKSSQHIDGQRLQLQILIIIKIAMVYIFINLPYSITFLVQYSMMLSKLEFVFVPCFLLHYEYKTSNPPPGTNYVLVFLGKIQHWYHQYYSGRREQPSIECLN